MQTQIIRIGNSHGVRIPKPILEKCGLSGRVEMNVDGRALVIAPVREARDGWSDAFKQMAEQGDDAPLLDDTPPSHWDEHAWVW